jgi:hypothetical protein
MARRRVPRYKRDGDGGEATPHSPSGRIPADLTKQALHHSYGGVPLFYEDQPFTCVDCGKEEVWTAQQQQWWYEVAKGSIYSRAKRCGDCRRARRAGVPPPQPIPHVGSLLKIVRADIEPTLTAAGFAFDSRSNSRDWREPAWNDFRRGDQMLSLAYEQHEARFSAEFLEASGGHRSVANIQIPQPPSMQNVVATIKEFTAAVISFLDALESYS